MGISLLTSVLPPQALSAMVLNIELRWAFILRDAYSEETLVADDRLLGTWVSECRGRLNFLSDNTTAHYKMIMHFEEEASQLFSVHVFKIEEQVFFDMLPVPPKPEFSLAEILHIPTHMIARVKIAEITLRLEFLNPGLLAELFSHDRISIDYKETDGDMILVTAPTSEVQRMLREVLEISKEEAELEAFSELRTYKKET